MRAQAILFDKDGTLLDFQSTWGPWSLQVVDQLANGDQTLTAKMERAWGLDRANQRILPDSVIIASTVENVAGAIVEFVPDMSLNQMIEFLNETGAQAKGMPVIDLNPFLDELADLDLFVGIATNDSEATARAQLRRLEVEHRFEFIAGYDSGFGGKPAPDMCLAFSEYVGVLPENMVMVGDSADDLQAGSAAGMQTVAVLTGVASAVELAPLADVVLNDIGDLVAWLTE